MESLISRNAKEVSEISQVYLRPNFLSYENGTIDDNEFSVLHQKIPISHTKNMTGFRSKR